MNVGSLGRAMCVGSALGFVVAAVLGSPYAALTSLVLFAAGAAILVGSREV